jgi:lipoate-protein ligase A
LAEAERQGESVKKEKAKKQREEREGHAEGRLILQRWFAKLAVDRVAGVDGSYGLHPAANLALEEALFLRNQDGLVVRLWENGESVIIGRAQLAQFETDVDYCKVHSIPIVRRFTAGGAVYNGPGNLNWSFFISNGFDSGRLRYESDPRAVFRMASSPLVSSLASLGVKAWLDPPNRVLTEQGKVSGMAAYVSRKGILVHGTLLLSADLGRVKALTTPAPDGLERKYTRSRDIRTANAGVDADSFIRTFLGAVGDDSRLSLHQAVPDEQELCLTRELLASRYGDASWNLGDPFGRDGAPNALHVEVVGEEEEEEKKGEATARLRDEVQRQ